jgi:uncharacterized membrane protein
MSAQKNWGDESVEIIIGNLLRTGVLLAASVVLIGAIVVVVQHGGSAVNYRVFRGEPADLRGLRGIIHDVIAFRGRGIIQLGLLFLIATPVARVAFSIWAFAKERDYMYVVFTMIVFTVLMYSLFGSG